MLYRLRIGTDSEDVILAAFKVLDGDNTGFLNKEWLSSALTSQADKFSQEECDVFMAAAPIDTDGKVDYKGIPLTPYI